MRRVIDDTHYDDIKSEIMDIVWGIPPHEVSEYSWGTHRAMTHLVKKYVGERMPQIKFGKCEHAHGIGNNNAWEIIYLGEDEEQICGLFHATDNMYGSVICWVSTYDNDDRTASRTIRGCEK